MAEPQEQEVESVKESIEAAIAELDAAEQPPPEDSPAEPVPNAEDDPEAAAEPSDEPEEVEEAPEGEEPPKLTLKSRERASEGKEAPSEDEEPKEEPVEAVLAPASWSKDDRQVWDKLDRPAQEVIARREKERDDEIRRTKTKAGPLEAVADEFETYFRQIGVTPDQSFRGLLSAEQSLRFGTPQQKADTLKEIARQYGISMPSQPAKGEATDDSDFADPEAAAVLRSWVDERLGKIEGELTSRQQAEQTAQENAANATANRFFEELEKEDASKSPEVRYIADVTPRFLEMVEVDRKTHGTPDVARLRELFSDAAWSVPSVRERMTQDLTARQQTEQKTVKRTVRKVASSASGGTGTSAHSEEPDINESVQDTVKRSMAELEQARGALR